MPRLEVDIDAEPGDDGGEPHVRGVVRTDDGHEREFLGWIGLVALLQQAIATP